MAAGLLRRAKFDDKMAALELAEARGDAATEEKIRLVLGRQERSLTGAAHERGRLVSYCEVLPPNLEGFNEESEAFNDDSLNDDGGGMIGGPSRPVGGGAKTPRTPGGGVDVDRQSSGGDRQSGSGARDGKGNDRGSAERKAAGAMSMIHRTKTKILGKKMSGGASLAGSADSSAAVTGDEEAAALLRDEFGLPEAEALLGRSVCTNERAAPGMLSVTSGYVCFKPAQAGAPGTAASTPNLNALGASHGASGYSGGATGMVKIGIAQLTLAERCQRVNKAGRSISSKSKSGYSIVFAERGGGRYTFHGVLHCDLVLQLLGQAAAALGLTTRRQQEMLIFEPPAREGGPQIIRKGDGPPALPGQPPALPGQPPALPGQPPALPGQPPALPGQMNSPRGGERPQTAPGAVVGADL